MPSKGSKVAYAVIGVFVAVCAIGWAIISVYAEGTPGISPEIIAWQASDHSVLVRFQLGKPSGRRVQCAVVAYDTAHAEIGRVAFVAPAGSGVVTASRSVPTSSRATAVDVKECRADG